MIPGWSNTVTCHAAVLWWRVHGIYILYVIPRQSREWFVKKPKGIHCILSKIRPLCTGLVFNRTFQHFIQSNLFVMSQLDRLRLYIHLNSLTTIFYIFQWFVIEGWDSLTMSRRGLLYVDKLIFIFIICYREHVSNVLEILSPETMCAKR